MGAKSKRKGKTYELEVAHALKAYGFEARRTNQFCGKTDDASDVVGLTGIHIECKHYANKAFDYAWMEQAKRDSGDNLPAVFHRTDRHETLVTMPLADWLKLYSAYAGKQII